MATISDEQRTTTTATTGTILTGGADGGGPLVPANGAAPAPAPREDYFDEPMTLQEHLKELRDRLIKAVLGVAVGTAIGFFLSGRLLSYMKAQVKAADEEGMIVQTGLTDAVVVYFKIAFYLGIAFAMPIILYQFIRFLTPGLTRKEKRYVYLVLPFALIFFALGVTFSSTVTVPSMILFLLEFSKNLGITNTIRIEDILGFYANVSLWSGIAFELPVVMFLLAALGVAPHRTQRKWRKYAAVGLMVVAAVITPTPDPINMLLVWAPMYLLFELGLIFTRFAPKRDRRIATA